MCNKAVFYCSTTQGTLTPGIPNHMGVKWLKTWGERMPRGFCKERKADSASPGCLQHLGVGRNRDIWKCAKTISARICALRVVRRSFWGDEQLGDGKSEWEGGRKKLGIGKDLPLSPSQKNGWVLVRLFKIPFSLWLALLFYWCKWTAGANLHGSNFSPSSTIFLFFFFLNPKFDFKNGDLDKILSAQQQLSF